MRRRGKQVRHVFLGGASSKKLSSMTEMSIVVYIFMNNAMVLLQRNEHDHYQPELAPLWNSLLPEGNLPSFFLFLNRSRQIMPVYVLIEKK